MSDPTLRDLDAAPAALRELLAAERQAPDPDREAAARVLGRLHTTIGLAAGAGVTIAGGASAAAAATGAAGGSAVTGAGVATGASATGGGVAAGGSLVAGGAATGGTVAGGAAAGGSVAGAALLSKPLVVALVVGTAGTGVGVGVAITEREPAAVESRHETPEPAGPRPDFEPRRPTSPPHMPSLAAPEATAGAAPEATAGAPPQATAGAPPQDAPQVSSDLEPPPSSIEAVARPTDLEPPTAPPARREATSDERDRDRDRNRDRAASPHDLDAERHLLREARRHLREDRPREALAALREHEHRFGAGVLGEERAALLVQAFARAGARDEAAARAAAFLRAYPNSIHRETVEAHLAPIKELP